MLSLFNLAPAAKILQLGDSTGALVVTPSPLPPIQCFYPMKAQAQAFYRVGGTDGPGASAIVRQPLAWVDVAVNGWALSDILAALPAQLTKYTPTHVVMHAGINDIQRSVPLVDSESDFTDILDLIAPLPFLVDLPYFWTGLNTEVVAFNAAMTAIAQTYDNVCLQNTHDLLGAPGTATLYTEPDTDEAHYNGAGRTAFGVMNRLVVRYT